MKWVLKCLDKFLALKAYATLLLCNVVSATHKPSFCV